MQNKGDTPMRERKLILSNKQYNKKTQRRFEAINLKNNDPIKFQKMSNSRRGGVSRWRD